MEGLQNNKIPNGTYSPPIHVVTLATDEELDVVNAVTGAKRKTAEELRAVRLQNLEKARAAKARYHQADEIAKTRGEVPPSFVRKVEREFPVMLDENKNVRELDLNKQLWETTVTLPLPQLLFYAPELRYQFLHQLGGQPISGKKKETTGYPSYDMEIDKEDSFNGVHYIDLDTTVLSLPKSSLQVVKVMVADHTERNFLLDGGAVVSVIPLHVVKQLQKESDIIPTNKTLRYGGGQIDVLAGVVKLKLQFAENITVYHMFCVTRNPSTPLLIGMDFIYASKAIQDPVKKTLTFRTDDPEKEYKVDTFDGDGYDDNVYELVDGGIREDQVIIPVSVTNSTGGVDSQDITIGYDWTFEPGEAQLLWIKLEGAINQWETDMVMQPSTTLFTKMGLYLVPTILKKVENTDPFCVIVVNMTQRPVSLKKGAELGQLFKRSVVPTGLKVIKSIDEIMDVVTELYINHQDHDSIIKGPSVLEGPIFESTAADLEALGITHINSGHNTKGIYHIQYGPDQDEIPSINAVESYDWDINPELSKEKREKLLVVLEKHRKVFATSLKDVKVMFVQCIMVVRHCQKPRNVPVSMKKNLWRLCTLFIFLRHI